MTPSENHPDAQVITAVRTGEIERFRELIERYERHVYAVAWARLGDASLAEDATQESFIRAFRLLRWVKDPSRFAGWITRIARAVSINLGLRHRRELNRRVRWALDPGSHAGSQPAEPEGLEPAPGSSVPTETFRTALAQLPARHRECLVLHYLEGRPIAEAAALLGVSEGALKVRLHRARRALRVRLEREIEASVGHLAPRRSLAPGIMSSILVKTTASDPTGTGAGLAAFLAGSLGKLLPATALLLLLPAVMLAASFTTRAWAIRAEQANYQDATGFRRRRYDDEQRTQRNRMAVLSLAAVLLLLAFPLLPGLIPWILVSAVPCLALTTLTLLRRTWLDRRFSRVLQTVLAAPMFAFLLLALFYEMPFWALPAAFAAYYLGMIAAPPDRPLRFDENLFLRHRLNLLPEPMIAEARRPGVPTPRTSAELLRYARWLAEAGLVVLHRWRTDGLLLRLRPVTRRLRDEFRPWPGREDSTLFLGFNGEVRARAGSADQTDLHRLGFALRDDADLESSRVVAAVQAGFDACLRGDREACLRCLGHQPDAQVFKVNPSSTGFHRLFRYAGLTGIVLTVGMLWFGQRGNTRSRSARVSMLEPVPYDLDDARAIVGALGTTATAGKPSRHRWDAIEYALHQGLVLPPFDWLPPEARDYLRTNGSMPSPAFLPTDPGMLSGWLHSWKRLKALHWRWAEPDVIEGWKASATGLRQWLETLPAAARDRLFLPTSISIANLDGSFLDLEPVRWRLTALADLGLQQAVDTRPLVELLREHQVLPGRPIPEGRIPLHGRDTWTGLFRTRGLDPIEETHAALVILELAGGLDTIDREACVRGLLRLHLGRGLFLPAADRGRRFERRQDSGRARVTLTTPGDARTTHAARESFRILGALHRVPDLHDWEYRIHHGTLVADLAEAHRGPGAWARIEAALLRAAAKEPPPAPSASDPVPPAANARP